jgi:hypothetical protein
MKKLSVTTLTTTLGACAAAGLLFTLNTVGCDSGNTNTNTPDMAVASGDMAVSTTPDMAMPSTPAFAKLSNGFKQPFGVTFDSATSAWYVANVDGMPTNPASIKDNKGSITKIPWSGGMPGTPDHAFFSTGLNAPTGIKASGGKLYFADVDQLVVLDIAAKTAVRSATLPAAAAPATQGLPAFMLDVTVDAGGGVFAVDATGGRLVRFATPMTANNTGAVLGNMLDYSGPTSIYLDTTSMKLVITEAGINQFLMLPGGVQTVGTNGMGKTALVTTTQNALAFSGCEKDGSDYLIGSPADKVIYRVNATTGAKTAIIGVADGATGFNDFGYDSASKTLAVPDAATNLVLFYKIQ